MPLEHGGKSKASKQAAVGANIRELTHSQTAAGKTRAAGPNAHARDVAIAMKAVYDDHRSGRRSGRVNS
jgi:hypothetical protein